MTIIELTKKYGEGKGDAMMWDAVAVISEAVEKSMAEDAREDLLRQLFGKMSGGHYDECFAEEAVEEFYYVDRAGVKHMAPYWTPQVVAPIYEKVKAGIPGYNMWDFYVVLNMVASDNWGLVDEWFPGLGPQEKDAKFVDLAVNWLKDPDYPGRNKIWRYLNGEK